MSEGFFALLGAVVGGLLTELGQLWRDRREARRRRYAELVDLYVTWVRSMNALLYSWTSTHRVGSEFTAVCLKLDFLEGSGEGSRLRLAVWATLPDELADPQRYDKMKLEQHTASWHGPFEWPEFDTAMSAVLEYVRRANPDAERVGLFKRR